MCDDGMALFACCHMAQYAEHILHILCREKGGLFPEESLTPSGIKSRKKKEKQQQPYVVDPISAETMEIGGATRDRPE